MITHLVSLQWNRTSNVVSVFDCLRVNQGDALLVVNDVQRFTLEVRGRIIAVILSIDFETTDVDPFVAWHSILRLNHFANTLTAGVVNVKSLAAAAKVY